MLKKIGVMAAVVLIGFLAGSLAYYFISASTPEFRLAPKTQAVGGAPEASDTEVGTGWSVKDNAVEAAREALGMALKDKKHATPDFAAIFATSGADLPAILAETRQIVGNKTRIYGGTSDSRGIMTNHGFIHAGEKDYAPIRQRLGLAVMTVTSPDICFGVGSADFSRYATPREGARNALRKAVESCGKSAGEPPQAVLAVISRSFEEPALEGFAEVVGGNIPLVSGTTGGPKFEVLGEQEAVPQGVSVAVIYTKLPLGWVFEGGFDVQDSYGGVLTRVEGGTIMEIDGRPALDVYDEWLGGKIKKLQQAGADDLEIRNLLILNPFYRRFTSREGQDYFLFSHPWPKDRTFQDKSLMTSTRIKQGEEIRLSHGTWERLLNRVGSLPVKARVQSGLDPESRVLFSIGYVCAGLMRVIPEGEREKMPLLINYANKNAPFTASFSWGEQGYFPGIGYKHGNLLTSFLVIGEKDAR